jgi:hypothetical protein
VTDGAAPGQHTKVALRATPFGNGPSGVAQGPRDAPEIVNLDWPHVDFERDQVALGS